MRKLVVLVVVIGALLAADVAARAWAESKLRERAAAYYPPSTAATASIRSFPFLGRLLVLGDVPEVTVAMENMQPGVVVVRRLTWDMETVEVDRSRLLRGQVRLVDVDRGRFEARIDGPTLAQAAGVDLRFREGAIEIHKDVRGVDVFATARVSMEENLVRFEPTSVQGVGLPLEAFAVAYEIPGPELVPCRAAVQPVEDGLLVSCTLDDVPAALVQGAS